MRKYRELRNCARVGLANLSVEIVDIAFNFGNARAERLFGMRLPVGSGDISVGGVGFTTNGPCPQLSVGDRLMVRFTLPDSLVELFVQAEVRHAAVRPGGGQRVGASFLDADELIAHPLFRYVEESLLAIRATSESFADQLLIP